MDNHSSAKEDVPAIAQTRKNLNEVRVAWANHSIHTPMFLSSMLSNGVSMQEFSYSQVTAHHLRRHGKSATAKKKQDSLKPYTTEKAKSKKTIL